MFVLLLTYIKPLPEVDALMPRHMAWLKEQYAAGRFVVSGRRIPRTGGVILARGQREMIEAMCAADPFVIHKIAKYEITEVAFTTVAHGIEILKT